MATLRHSLPLTRPAPLAARHVSTASSQLPTRRAMVWTSVCASGEQYSSEPKWKQKLAKADKHAEETRQATARAAEEYRRRQMAQRQREEASGGIPRLADLPWVPYLTAEGLITDCTQEGAKASVYGIFDQDKVLQYIGVSRQVYQSMRLHFARVPTQCHWVKATHIARPSKAALEAIRDAWAAENGGRPAGNDEGAEQQRWENPVDCKPLMTEEEKTAVAQAAPGPPKAKALKQVARRVERELEAAFQARQCTEVLRFDPKLKEEALLDLKSTQARAPDTAVPTSKPTDAKDAASSKA
eukprot:TRINITY_DN16078_c0_g1_i1.p1 TRINITY_DN16078_c0_g1~~TRINITY_DN16078_c0_g1_i1.p1  ORF type:complete len:307 (-),score=0.66 TRINITY_DN16078_c0_g1_i1:30-926(-)